MPHPIVKCYSGGESQPEGLIVSSRGQAQRRPRSLWPPYPIPTPQGSSRRETTTTYPHQHWTTLPRSNQADAWFFPGAAFHLPPATICRPFRLNMMQQAPSVATVFGFLHESP